MSNNKNHDSQPSDVEVESQEQEENAKVEEQEAPIPKCAIFEGGGISQIQIDANEFMKKPDIIVRSMQIAARPGGKVVVLVYYLGKA